MFTPKNHHPASNINLNIEIDPGISREIPESMDTNDALAFNQNSLAVERTEFAKIRTDLALTNSMLAVNRTHLSYLRTVVSLVGSGATLYKALPLIGVGVRFTTLLCGFLFLAAIYFAYKDAATYPRMKRKLHDMETRAEELAKKAESQVFRVDDVFAEDDASSLDSDDSSNI